MPWLRKSSWSSTPQRPRLSNPHWRTWTPELALDEPLDGHGHGQYEQAEQRQRGCDDEQRMRQPAARIQMSVSTPAVVALATTAATASTTISMQAKVQCTRSTGLRIRRSS
jgi:hypothetical protein